MLDDAYHRGYSDGKYSNMTITYPSTTTYWTDDAKDIDISYSSTC